MSNYTKLAVRGVAIVFIVSILAAFLGYLVRLILARNLEVEEFGLFYAVFSFLALVGLFKSLGYDRALIKFIPEFKHKVKNDLIKSSIVYVVLIQLITNSIIIIAVYLFANYLSINFFHNSQATIVLKLMAIAFFIDSFIQILKFSFQGFNKMLYFSSIDFVRMLLIIAVILVGFNLNYGLLGPVYAYILAPFVIIIIFSYILLKKVFPNFFKEKFIVNWSLLRRISKYSIFILATGVGTAILYHTDILVLTYFTDLEKVALYSVALPTAKILIYFPRAIGTVLQPLTTEFWVKKEKNLLKAGIESLYKYSIIIIIPLAFIMLSFTELLIGILYGKDYVLASNAMKILVIGMIFAVLYGINISVFAGIGKPQYTSKIIYIAAIFNLIANIILIPKLGVVGAALATTGSYFIMMAVGLMDIRKFIKLIFPIKVWIKTLIAGIIFILLIWLLKELLFLNVWIETTIVLSISSIVYVVLLFLLKVINIDELNVLYKRIVK